MNNHKQRMKVWMLSFLLMISMVMQYIVPVYAASASVWASANTVYVGDSVTFTVSVSNGAGNITVSGAVNDYAWFENGSKTYTVRANAVGTLRVSISGTIADFSTETDANVSDSATVNVVARPSNQQPSGNGSSGGNTQPNTPQVTTPVEMPKSSNANLSDITLSQGTLSPQFQPSVTDYSVALEKNVTSIKVDASAEDGKASVSGTGEASLEPGENTLTINVTAEDGTQKQYVIKVHVDESPDVFIDYNGKQLGVVKNLNGTQPPTTFEPTTISLDGKEVTAYHSNLINLTIIYMVDEANERNFYLYDEITKSIISIFKPIALLGKNVFIIDIPSEMHERSGMKYGEVTVDEQKFMGWSFEDPAFANYTLLYMMDEKGNKQYYLYESTENTLQLYSGQAALSQDRYEELAKDRERRGFLILGLGATNALTFILLLIVFLKKRKPKKSKVVVQPKTKSREQHPDQTMNAYDSASEEEIIPFDAWKYEDPIRDQGIHIQPYENESHLFDQHDETINE